MTVFIMLFLFVVSIIIIIIAGVAAQKPGGRANARFAVMVIAAMGYTIALPIYTTGWIISRVVF